MSSWLVVAFSGVTNGGKTSMTKQLMEVLPSSTKLICQDDYFFPEDSPKHVPAPGGLNHHNWDVITSMDMIKMKEDMSEVMNSIPKDSHLSGVTEVSNFVTCEEDSHFSGMTEIPDSVTFVKDSPISGMTDVSNSVTCDFQALRPILLLDGFLLYDDAELTELCDLRYFFTLSRERCWERRRKRVYDPADPPGYFEYCIWPMYEKHLKHVEEKVKDVLILDGEVDHFKTVYQHILQNAMLKTC